MPRYNHRRRAFDKKDVASWEPKRLIRSNAVTAMRKNMKALMPNLPGIEFWPDLDTPDDVETANLELSCTVEAVHARAEILTPTMAEILQFQPTTHWRIDQ